MQWKVRFYWLHAAYYLKNYIKNKSYRLKPDILGDSVYRIYFKLIPHKHNCFDESDKCFYYSANVIHGNNKIINLAKESFKDLTGLRI